MITISNEYLICQLDEKGRMVWLEDRKGGKTNVIKTPVELFKAVLHRGENWEDVVFHDQQSFHVSACENTATLRVPELITRMGKADIELELRITLEKDRLLFHAVIDNRSDAVLNDFYYPCLGGIDSLGGGRMDLIYPEHMGSLYTDVAGYLSDMKPYDGFRDISSTYPWPLSMSWMMLTDGEHCLYYGSHDQDFYSCTLNVIGSDRRDVVLQLTKMPFVGPGETWTAPLAVVSLYAGSWRNGADIYGDWCATWRKPVSPPEWVREMNGYFLAINRQQYGDELWPYETIPQLWELAKAHGFDTLGLFGWYSTGHDNRYPQIEPSRTMGGDKMLREMLSRVRDDGAHVTLYQNGNLIDPSSDFYEKYGESGSLKTRWGLPYQEYYSKFHNSAFLELFSRKSFLVACPGFEPFQKVMEESVSMVHDLGASGILVDQVGGLPPYPCFDPKHGHQKPSLAVTTDRRKLLSKIRARTDTYKSENFAFFAELLTDLFSQYVDMLHNVASAPGPQGERIGLYRKDSQQKVSAKIQMPEPFRYLFPELISTVRNAHAAVHPRMAHYAFIYGYRLEMELRYLQDKEDILGDIHPDWREHAKAISDMRVKHKDFLLRGRYRADEGITWGNDALICSVFENDQGEKAIAVWNDSPDRQPLKIEMPGYDIVGSANVNGESDGCPAWIDSNDVLLLLTSPHGERV